MEYMFSKLIQRIEMGEGTRVELDFIDVLGENEGVLVGDSSRGYIRVLSECRKTETYPPRPFRVNAGAIHQYLKLDAEHTKYLSEVEPGDQVIVSDGQKERYVSLGRVKIEKRPCIKIVLESGISGTLQEADSVFIAGRDGPLHFLDLKEGDWVEYCPEESVARHKGDIIDEDYILEK